MAALALTSAAVIAATDGYIETPRHGNVRLLLGVSRFKPPETPASFVKRESTNACTTVTTHLVNQRGEILMAHEIRTDMGKPPAQDEGLTHSAVTDAPQTPGTSGGSTIDTYAATAMPSAFQRCSSMTRCLQLVRYESLPLRCEGLPIMRLNLCH